MVCSNCGAEYDNTFIKCPYCGQEYTIPGHGPTKAGSKKSRPTGPKNYSRSTKEVSKTLHIKPETAQKILKLVPWIAGALMGLVIVIVLLKFFKGFASSSERFDRISVYTLDEMIEANDYSGVYSYMKEYGESTKGTKYSLYYAVYKIYSTVSSYESLSQKAAVIIENGLTLNANTATDAEIDALYSSFYSNAYEAFSVLNQAYDTALSMKSVFALSSEDEDLSEETYDSEAIYTAIDNMLLYYATDCVSVYGLTEDEVYEIYTISSEDTQGIDSYVQIAYRRLFSDIFDGYIE